MIDASNRSTHIRIDTAKLWDFSVSLKSIKSAAENVSQQLNDLYQLVGLVDLAALLDDNQIDKNIYRLDGYADALTSIAGFFDDADNQIKSKTGTDEATVPNDSTPDYQDTEKENSQFPFPLKAGMSGSINPGSKVSGSTQFFDGVEASGEAGWKAGEYDLNAQAYANAGYNDEKKQWNISAGAKASASFSALAGEASGNVGCMSGKVQGKFLSSTASSDAHVSLIKDGELDPEINVSADAKVSALSGSAETKLGSDTDNIHASANGDVGFAEANAQATISKDGAKVKLGAVATAAKGNVNVGRTIMGIKIDTIVEGYAGAIGIDGGGEITSSGAELSADLAALLGVGVKVKIDWSGFNPMETINEVKDWLGI